ncbi:protein FAR1-RELATED SEQUENCE 5-like [Camellia sinensis]|uniref:protein FAR1-RELATED SEQUENCE 5-like n=1 Tax=Camellia sinensis TaxID=4442 RepID=UPI00103669B0|nr:protein FAR1-RELATED SEQUENCE 5-like [Camellia sinensis]
MVPAKVKSEGVDYDIPNEADDIHLINESQAERCHGCEAGPRNKEATNINVEDGRIEVKQEMVDDAHGDDMVEKRRAPKALTRVGCKAQFRIWYDLEAGEGGKYVVTHFIADHNNELAEQHCVMYLRSHRDLNSVDKAQVMAMRNVGVKTSQIMDYMVNQSGCYENVGFICTDLHNHIQAKRRAEVEDGDAQGALEDSKSRADYAKFGDVLIFDSTYHTHVYKKPFVMLAGVPNHFITTIFACVLLANGTIDVYTLVLETFMEAMDNSTCVRIDR